MFTRDDRWRTESDSIGSLQVPADAFYGVQTLRAVENFPITGQHIPDEMINSLAYIKKAAAVTNRAAGDLPAPIAQAIITACDEIIAGKWHEQFIVDVIQGGAGTSTNMRESALNGTYVGGPVPFGYFVSADRKLCVDDQTAPLVRYVFEEYDKGTGAQAIIDHLNERGIRSHRGLPIAHSWIMPRASINSICPLRFSRFRLKNHRQAGMVT